MEDLVDIFKRNDCGRISIFEEIEAEEKNKRIAPKHISNTDFLDEMLDYNEDNLSNDPFIESYNIVHGEDEYLDNIYERLNGRTIEESSSAHTKYCDHVRCGYIGHRD